MVGHTVYRLVQEALTNTRKHAGPDARVEVLVEVHHDGEDEGVEGNVMLVSVRDNGAHDRRMGTDGTSGRDHARTAPVPGTGLRLAGMRERVRAVGGRLHTGRTDEGFTVNAALPMTADPR